MNKKLFFDYIRPKDRELFWSGTLTNSQVKGIEAIIEECKNYGCTLGQTAYILATAGWESAHKYQPIREFGQGEGKSYGQPTGPYNQRYYGRGLIQITWMENYRKAGQRIGVDLVKYPDAALVPENALKLLVQGMMEGWYTEYKLPQFISSTKREWEDARLVVNGTDKAKTLRNMARVYQDALIVAGFKPKEKEMVIKEPLPGQKTNILSIVYGILAIVEILGYFDFPFITDPWMSIQVAATAILIRLGIKKTEGA